eukprot:5825976-Prymnesium_polylepis.2
MPPRSGRETSARALCLSCTKKSAPRIYIARKVVAPRKRLYTTVDTLQILQFLFSDSSSLSRAPPSAVPQAVSMPNLNPSAHPRVALTPRHHLSSRSPLPGSQALSPGAAAL